MWVTVLAVAAAWGVASAGGPLEGRWLLVEQSYGSAGSDMLEGEPPLRLEFAREGGRLAGRVWIEDGTSERSPWPSALDGEDAAVRIDDVVVAPDEDGVRARYRIEHASGDVADVEIVEEYRVDDDGDTLSGTVTVTSIRDGERRGSYVLHRRFVREP
jgi:hypothetical protein